MELEPNIPFRWAISDARLGSLLDDLEPPDLWYADPLLECAAKILARSAGGDLFFVGRSCDSVHDLLGGLLHDTPHVDRLHLLPGSFGTVQITPDRAAQLRVNLRAAGLDPQSLAGRAAPVVFVDVVATGSTYEALFGQLRAWIGEERAQWDVIRRKLRFIGVTCRKKTSPNTVRWQQEAEWTKQLPANAIVNVSLSLDVWSQIADRQHKTNRSFRPHAWLDESVRQPRRTDEARSALSEAVALHHLGRQPGTRETFARLLAQEDRFAERWLRSLTLRIRGR